MTLELQNVFTGKGVGFRKVQYYTFIDDLVLGIDKTTELSHPWRW
jgi:hypothetical protein